MAKDNKKIIQPIDKTELVWPNKRKENKNMWKVSIKQIQERNYNLDFKNPNSSAKAAHKDPKEVLESIAGAERKIAKILSEIKKYL